MLKKIKKKSQRYKNLKLHLQSLNGVRRQREIYVIIPGLSGAIFYPNLKLERNNLDKYGVKK